MTALGALAPDPLLLSASVRSDVQIEHRDLGRDPSRSALLARLELNCVPHAIVMARYLVRMAASPVSVTEECVGVRGQGHRPRQSVGTVHVLAGD